MKCEFIRPLLYRLIEDRLLASDQSAVRRHVDGCNDCAQRFRQIAALDESVMNAESEQPSPSLRPKLIAAFRCTIADRRTDSSVWASRTVAVRRAAVFALVALGASIAIWLGVRQNDLSSLPPVHVTDTSITLDHVFPLRFSTPYTVQHEDGLTHRGVHIQFVQ